MAARIPIYKNISLIYNPHAGRLQRNPKHFEDAVAALERAGHTVRRTPTEGPGMAGEQARRAIANGADLILACGGDGTINESVGGVIGSTVPFAILPGGTANVLSMETGQGAHMVKVARSLSQLVPRRISIGKLQAHGQPERDFLIMLGAGLDAKVVAEVKPNVKRTLGKAAYWLSGLMQTGKKLDECLVRTDEGEYTASFILVSRVRNYGGDLTIAQNVTLLDDDFEVVLFAGSNSLRFLPYFAAVITGQQKRMPGITILRSKRVELHSLNGTPVLVQTDGELSGSSPATIEIVPNAVTLLLPQRYVDLHDNG